jgi:hypothetical protein
MIDLDVDEPFFIIQGNQVGRPIAYGAQINVGSSSAGLEQGRSPSAGPNGRVDWKAKYLN